MGASGRRAGGGIIGVSVIIGAHNAGARVIAVEPSEARQEALMHLGVDAVINPTRDDFSRVIEYLQGHFDEAATPISRILPFEEAHQALPYWNHAREARSNPCGEKSPPAPQ